MAFRFFALMTFVLASFSSLASEPSYCDPKNFSQYEQDLTVEGAKRLHVYQIGGLTLAGLAIGKTPVEVTSTLAFELGGVGADQKYCTWYLNDGNDDAAATYSHQYVPRPWFWDSKKKIAAAYAKRLGGAFADEPINMVECAIDNGYIALGCDGMKHRGPSVFAMFLAYSGCSPKNAAKIANQVWGLDTVPAATRLEIAKAGYKLGNENPRARQALQQLMRTERINHPN